ncbi:MAG: hypothetical protein JMDDDDMK_03777 [Acidobacteria bacterium]|nr:hypothetical protein [Acidobacteriota bacterium]
MEFDIGEPQPDFEAAVLINRKAILPFKAHLHVAEVRARVHHPVEFERAVVGAVKAQVNAGINVFERQFLGRPHTCNPLGRVCAEEVVVARAEFFASADVWRGIRAVEAQREGVLGLDYMVFARLEQRFLGSGR